MTSKKTPAPPETVEVVLTAPHTHNSQPLQKGDRITVTLAQRDWLQRQQLIHTPEVNNV